MIGILADAVLAVHVAFVLFVVAGQVLILLAWAFGWRAFQNSFFRIAHLVAIGVVVLQAWLGVLCPLTIFENYLREISGTVGYEDMSFVGYWLTRVLYYEAPPWVFILVYSLFGLLVLVSFIFFPPTFSRAARPEGASDDAASNH